MVVVVVVGVGVVAGTAKDVSAAGVGHGIGGKGLMTPGCHACSVHWGECWG